MKKQRKNQTRRKRQNKKQIRQRKNSSRRLRGGNKKVYYTTEESPTRPNYPVVRVVVTEKDEAGFMQQLEEHFSKLGYEIEDYLVALKRSEANEKLPKMYVVKGQEIIEPVYIPPSV